VRNERHEETCLRARPGGDAEWAGGPVPNGAVVEALGRAATDPASGFPMRLVRYRDLAEGWIFDRNLGGA